MIDVRDLVKRYKKADRNAVDGISFHVRAGEFFALLGPNGAGKTTMISVLTTTLGARGWHGEGDLARARVEGPRPDTDIDTRRAGGEANSEARDPRAGTGPAEARRP